MRQTLLLMMALIFALPCGAYAMETSAKHALLIDMDTHSVLLSKDAEAAMAPSSMSKLMTTYVLFSRLKEGRVKLDSQFTVSEKAWRTQGSKTFVSVGGTISVEDLIHGIVIQSGNDACIVVAENISGSEEDFVKEMNRIASEIGLKHSHFVNASGLPEEGHVMSARDLATLAERLIRDFPEYYHYFSLPEYTYNNIKQQNRNRLLTSGIGVDGLKTGHAEEAGYGITASARQGERRLILVVNGLASDKARLEESERLLRYGFREFENKTLVKKGQKIAEADVWFGVAPKVGLVAAGDAVVTVPAGGSKDISYSVKYTGPLPAPIAKDAKVAELIITVPGAEPVSVPLSASEDVAKLSGFKRIAAVVRHFVLGK